MFVAKGVRKREEQVVNFNQVSREKLQQEQITDKKNGYLGKLVWIHGNKGLEGCRAKVGKTFKGKVPTSCSFYIRGDIIYYSYQYCPGKMIEQAVLPKLLRAQVL